MSACCFCEFQSAFAILAASFMTKSIVFVVALHLFAFQIAYAQNTSCDVFSKSKTMRPNVSGSAVKELQKMLNRDADTKVASQGSGSPGKETIFYGKRTKLAVISFQEKYKNEILSPNNLKQGTGVVGVATKQKLLELYCGSVPVAAPKSPVTQPAVGATKTQSTSTRAGTSTLQSKNKSIFDPLVSWYRGTSGSSGGPAAYASPSTGGAAPALPSELAPVSYMAVNVSLHSDKLHIVTSPVLSKKDGTQVAALEDLPEGVASYLKSMSEKKTVRVIFENGVYRISSPLVITEEVSGTSEFPVVFEARNPGQVTISGAVDIAIPASASGTSTVNTTALAPFEQLWVNGVRAVRARTPNAGSFFYIASKASQFKGASVAQGLPIGMSAFIGDPVASSLLIGATPADLLSAVIVVFNSWTTGHHRYSDLDSSNDTLKVSPPSKWQFGTFGTAQRYFVENLPDALDASGEWFLDASKMLTYIKRPVEIGSALSFAIPQVSSLLEIKGTTSVPVSNVMISGIRFSYAGYVLPQAGYTDSQAASKIPGAITVTNADNVVFSDCEVSHVGGYGIVFGSKARNSVVDGCDISDLGAGGIKIGNETYDGAVDAVGGITVKNSAVYGTGFQFPGAVALLVMNSSKNTITHNTITDTTYSGISVGWNWNNTARNANNNTITKNHITDIGQNSMSDMGGIYTLGSSTGTVVKGNVIERVHGFLPDGGVVTGLYFDEGSSHIVAESNVVKDTDTGAVFVHKNSLNLTLRGNILAGQSAKVPHVGKEFDVGHGSSNQVTLIGNFVFASGSLFMPTHATTDYSRVTFQDTVISSAAYSTPSIPSLCGQGCRKSDKLVLMSSNGMPNATLDSQMVVPSSVLPDGVIPVRKYAFPSPSLLYKQTEADIRVPNIPYSISSAALPVGSSLPLFTTYPARTPPPVSVQTIDGTKCFAFLDSGTFTNRYDPFTTLPVSYTSGVISNSFKIKMQESGVMNVEFRNTTGGSPYLSGPYLVFDVTKGVKAYNGSNTVTVGPMPLKEWVTVSITARMAAPITYDVSLVYADGTRASNSGLSPRSTGWNSLKGLFYISDAATTTSTCIDDINLSNQ